MIQTVLDIIEKYELGDVVAWILNNNPSQALPYHNFAHSLDVMYYSSVAYCYDDGTTPKSATIRYGISQSVMPKEMLLAALFHDFGHSGGFFADDAGNVQIAVTAFGKYEAYTNFKVSRPGTIEDLIRNTQYPHSIPDDTTAECRFMGECLLDADMFQYCVTTMNSMVGIRQEYYKHISWDELLEKTIDFLSKIEYRIAWGKVVAEPKKQETIEQLKRFQQACFRENP